MGQAHLIVMRKKRFLVEEPSPSHHIRRTNSRVRDFYIPGRKSWTGRVNNRRAGTRPINGTTLESKE